MLTTLKIHLFYEMNNIKLVLFSKDLPNYRNLKNS